MDEERFLDLYRRGGFALAVWAGIWLGGSVAVLLGAGAGFPGRSLAWSVLAGSLLSLALYGIDKLAAVRKSRRIPESALHLTAVLGGWPGAAIGQQLFRHKTRKVPFLTRFLATAAIHSTLCAGAYLLLAWIA